MSYLQCTELIRSNIFGSLHSNNLLAPIKAKEFLDKELKYYMSSHPFNRYTQDATKMYQNICSYNQEAVIMYDEIHLIKN